MPRASLQANCQSGSRRSVSVSLRSIHPMARCGTKVRSWLASEWRMCSGWRGSTRLSSSASITPLLSRASRSSRAPLSLVVRWPLSSTRTEPLHEGDQVVWVSPIADGSLGSGSWRNTLIFQGDTIRHLRFKAGLMNKVGSWLARSLCSAFRAHRQHR